MSHNSAPAMLIEIRDPRFPLVMFFSSSSASSLTEYASLLEHSTPFIFPLLSQYPSYPIYSSRTQREILSSSVLHSLDRLQFATIDHHRGRARRQSVSIRNLCRGWSHAGPRGRPWSLGLHSEDRQPSGRAPRDRAEDDRRLEAIGLAARSTYGRPGGIDRRSGTVASVPTAIARTVGVARGRRVSETVLYIAGPKTHSAEPCPTKGAPPFPRAAL